jgi:hypothetical protein
VKTSPPLAGRETYKRRFLSYPGENGVPEKACRAGQGLGARGKGILPASSCHPRRRTWESRAEALYGGLAEGIITTPEVVMMDWTSWSSPIGAARQMEQKDNS